MTTTYLRLDEARAAIVRAWQQHLSEHPAGPQVALRMANGKSCRQVAGALYGAELVDIERGRDQEIAELERRARAAEAEVVELHKLLGAARVEIEGGDRD